VNGLPSEVLAHLLELASRFAAPQAQPNSRVYADLDINGGDFVELVEEVERLYCVDLSWVSPRAHCNFCRIHKSLRVSPAMAAGITDRLWTLEDVVAKIDAMTPAPKPRGPYKKRETR
jgi:hypothetical protein